MEYPDDRCFAFCHAVGGKFGGGIQNYALKQHGGDLALGANGIITSVGMLLVMLIIGIAQGMQPIVGFNFGAKKYERVQETLRLVIITSTIIMGVGCFCSVAFPKLITRAFTNDPDLLDVTAMACGSVCWYLWLSVRRSRSASFSKASGLLGRLCF